MKAGISRSFLLGTSLFAVFPVAAHAADDQSSAGPAVAEIIVTAQKREQRLQDVPVSITALTSDMLQANRVQNIGDLNAISPNATVRESAGGVGLPVVTMRGALSQGVGEGQDREVGFYVDGVYIGHAQGSQFDLADIDRIEVLRGPQGTLFGRNATGGAISIVTRDPTGVFGLSQEFTVGNYNQFRSKTRIDLPAVGPFSAAVTYTHSERRGEIRNLGAGTVWDFSAAGLGQRKAAKWLGSQNVDSIAAALKFEPGDAVELVYKFDWSDMRGTPIGFGSAGFGPPIDGGLTAALYALQPDPAILTPITTRRPKAVNNSFTTQSEGRVQGHNLTATWQVSDSVSLKNIFAYRKANQLATQDITGLGGVVIPAGFEEILGAPVGTPLLLGSTLTQYYHKQVSDEVQLNITTNPVTITAGAIYYHQKQGNGAPEGLQNGYLFIPVPGNVLYCVSVTACAGPSPTRGTSKAAYIQVEGHLTPEIDIVGGYRITNDRKSGRSPLSSFRINDDNPAYLIGANYRPTADILLFAKYAQSYMSGGGNTGRFPDVFATYGPETAYSWEAGIKSDLLNRRVRLNLSLFTVRYEDIQYVTGGNVCGDSAAGVCVFNASDGRARGFELETTVVPARGLTLNGGLGYTDFKYRNVNPLVLESTGYFFPQLRPKWTSNLAAQYDTQPLFGDAYASFRFDANFRSRTRLDPLAPPANESQVTIGSIWLLNGRISLNDVGIAGHKAQIALWGKNLTNDDHMSFLTVFQFTYPISYERTRTFGIDVKFDW